jgi:hypothetical protein
MGILIHTKFKLIQKGNGNPVAGPDVLVKLYDKDTLLDDFLGTSTPNHEGAVSIEFDSDKIKSIDSPLEQFPDLYFKVFKADELVFESPVASNVNPEAEGSFDKSEGQIIDLGTFLI